MRNRESPLRTRSTKNWFVIDVPNRGPHAFRVPRAMVLAELMSILRLTNIDRKIEDVTADLARFDAGTTTRLRASEEAMGACIGACWRHAMLELETSRHSFADDPAGLRRYGDAVMDELEDADYSEDEVKALLEALVPRLMSAMVPGSEEVAKRAATFPDA